MTLHCWNAIPGASPCVRCWDCKNWVRVMRERYAGLLDRVALYATMDGDGEFREWRQLIDTIHA